MFMKRYSNQISNFEAKYASFQPSFKLESYHPLNFGRPRDKTVSGK